MIENILFFISLLIIAIVILNLLNLSLYLSKKRYKYLKMCTKIGLDNKKRKRFILYENGIIYGLIFIPSTILSLIMSVVLSYFFNLKYIEGYAIKILNMRYYFLSLFVLILFLFLIVVLTSKLALKFANGSDGIDKAHID